MPHDLALLATITMAFLTAFIGGFIARSGTESGVERLAAHGARFIIHPELVGGLEIVRFTLLTLGYPMEETQGSAADRELSVKIVVY
jgi:CPA2 family monovalent cation:H+ antiporter-2